MNTTRTWTLGGVAVAVLLFALGWILLVSPTRGQASELETQAVSQAASNDQLQIRLDRLRQDAEALPALEAQIAALARQLPADPQLPQLLRTVENIADAAGVTLVSFTPGEPVAPTQTAAPAPQGAATGTAAEQPAAAAQPPAAQAPAAATAYTTIPISIQASGRYANNALFITGLERMQRALLIKGFQLSAQPSTTGGASTGLLTLNLDAAAFTAPSPLATTKATPAAPAATTTPAPAAS